MSALRDISQTIFHSYWQTAVEDGDRPADPPAQSSRSGGFRRSSESTRRLSGAREGGAGQAYGEAKPGLRQRVLGHRKTASSSSKRSQRNSSESADVQSEGPRTISLEPFPPAVPSAVLATVVSLERLSLAILFGAAVLWLVLAALHRSGRWSFVVLSLACATLGAGASFFPWSAARHLARQAERERWRQHRQRAKTFAPPYPESAEWLNALIEGVWGTLSPDLFNSIVDTVEDIMQASLPQFVDAVKISDVGQGRHPIRLTAVRPLPDREREGHSKSDDEERVREALSAEGQHTAQGESRYINLEVAFAYRGASHGVKESSRDSHIHLLINFYLGLGGWAQVPVPVWVQVEEIVGTVRVRLQLTPQFPFVRDVTFSFMGVPAFKVSAVPMTRALPNVLDLPLISKFVKEAIAAGTAEFTAPKSMTLNMADILGDAAIGDTRAAGVFLITIHHAEDLSAQDKSGSSDPYIVFSYSKFGRAEYSTRTILQDLNPVFEETFPILLTTEQLKNEESLLLMLWDKDRFTSDDLIGRIRIPITDLIKNPGKVERRSDAVKGFEKGGVSQGTLHWSVAYYPKIPLNTDLEAPPTLADVTPSRTLPELEMRPGDKAPLPGLDTPPPPALPLRTAPDPRWKSGILSIVVHELAHLEKAQLRGSGGQEGEDGQDTDDLADIDVPSPYAEILYNDQLLYQTRVKARTNDCIMEAGTEKFVRNIDTAVVRVVVRTSTLRERDPILGIVNLPLRDILTEACEVTRSYPLEKGVGFGLAKISLLFRAVAVDLPRGTQGWETGVLIITSPLVLDVEPEHRSLLEDVRKVVLSTADGEHTLKRKDAAVDGTQARWDANPIKLPVYFRQQAVLTFEFQGLHVLHPSKEALASLWLHELVDHEEREISLPVYKSQNLKQLKQNYINDFTAQTHDLQQVGTLRTKIVLQPGLGPCHYSSPANGPSGSQGRRHALEAWDTFEGQALLSARKAAAAADDGKTDHYLKKDLKRAETRQKAHHQQGRFEVPAYRTLLWAANGVRERVTPHRTTYKRRPVVLSERNLA